MARKPLSQYRVVVTLAGEIVWEQPGYPIASLYAAERSALTLNQWLRQGGTQMIADVRDEPMMRFVAE